MSFRKKTAGNKQGTEETLENQLVFGTGSPGAERPGRFAGRLAASCRAWGKK